MNHLEIEVKFHIADLPGLRRHILEKGAESAGRDFEANIRFDDRHNSLFAKGALLRLRKTAAKTVLTHKSIPARADRRFKVFNELEISVSDFEVTNQILESLGFFPKQAYEKWRETMAFNHTVLCLDEMPFGDFLEIEGNPDDIRSAAAQLGLDWQRRSLMNYLEIFSRLKNALQLPFSDVTFENFKTHQIDASKVASQLGIILTANQKS